MYLLCVMYIFALCMFYMLFMGCVSGVIYVLYVVCFNVLGVMHVLCAMYILCVMYVLCFMYMLCAIYVLCVIYV